ncbi:MAG: ParB/RepB/Spo0J family partition protein [Prevotellaceae bacterium]|jgi:ParB family chromosome partitioning protein|nr:ParB/RepB/Spo0J family partition protein [Prevotellaceae bacterium]
MAKQVLGKGIGALLSIDEVRTEGSSSVGEIEIAKIERNKNQPRTHFDKEALQELAASIRAVGVIQPITVRKIAGDKYQIIAGERRFRASQLAGLKKIPAYIKTADDDNVMKMALVENIQREDLNAIEEALAYQNLAENYKLTQAQLSELVGKKRATVTNYLRLLKLPAEIQLGITQKRIDMAHARALVSVEDPAAQLQIYKRMLTENLTVRKVEELVRELNQTGQIASETPEKAKKTPAPAMLNEQQTAWKQRLSDIFSRKVELSCNEKGQGKISIPFANNEELAALIHLLDNK